ncbi:serine/threonine-protein kinase [Dactylosporangium sp. CA-233914]|uniref:serine/threonine-protein kinase n=1 Tax=Dactylosporangium sp. CA-233914 TaxID=3239934 RepID=UPI003D93C464
MEGGPGHAGPADALDRYEFVQRHAAGGEGEVWLAREHHGAESFSYAVKVIRIDDDSVAERQLEELRLQAALATQLEHPALVKVKEVFVGPPPHPAGQGAAATGRRLYFVMKWIEGRNLQESLERGEIQGLDVLAPLEPVAEAIDYLHSGQDTNGAPVLHRDIKPANVLLAADGRVYLVDFGLVRLRGTDRTSRIFGTAPFMAPESLARGEYSPATDRYTLGATVYYALTGEAPIPGDVQGMTQRLTAALGPGKDREARGILAMLAAQPDARPASAARWVRALRTAPPQTTVSPQQIPAQISPPPPTAASPSGYRLPPGSFTGSLPGPPPQPVSYPMPPGSLGGPQLSPAASGYVAAAPPKKSGAKVPLMILGAVLLLVVGCCSFTVYKFGSSAARFSSQPESTGRPGAGPTRSFDKSKPPPPVTELRSALVSVGDITAVMRASRETIESRGSGENYLHGGLSSLKLCADGAVAGDAIAGSETNNFKVTGAEGYPFVGSAVAGFYGDEAKVFFASLRDKAGRCGWTEMQTAKLGDETLGVFSDDGSTKLAIVFVRSGQAAIEVVVTGQTFMDLVHGSYQSDAIQLATAMANRLPKSGS